MDTLQRASFAALIVSWMFPGSHVDMAAKTISTCTGLGFSV